MEHISTILPRVLSKIKKYRYTASRKHKEMVFREKCMTTQAENKLQYALEQTEHEKVRLNSLTDAIQKVRNTYPPDKQDAIIKKLLEARRLLETTSR